MGAESLCGVVIAAIFILGIGAGLFLHFIPVHLWITALASGVNVGLPHLVGMRLKGVPPNKIILPLIMSSQSGVFIPISELEDHYLAGGRVSNVVGAVIAANKAGIALDIDKARTIDLAGRDVLEAVKMSVNQK